MKKLILILILFVSTLITFAQQTFPTQMEGQYTCETRYGCNSTSTIFITRDSTDVTKFYFLDTCNLNSSSQLRGDTFKPSMRPDSITENNKFTNLSFNCSSFGQFFPLNDSIYVDRIERGCGSGCTCHIEYKCKKITTSISENAFSQLKIAPNPTNGFIKISGIKNKVNYSLLSISGQVLLQGVLNYSEETINLSYFQNGIYFLKIQNEDGMSVRKIIKQ